MIRINLIPGKKPKRAEAGQRHLVYMGVGLLAKGCKDLTIKNLVVRGAKISIRIKSCPRLVVRDCDVSHNYRAHLRSRQPCFLAPFPRSLPGSYSRSSSDVLPPLIGWTWEAMANSSIV